jgi:hypothetical protein
MSAAARCRAARRHGGAYVITDARHHLEVSTTQLTRPLPLIAVVAAHRDRADLIAAPVWRGVYWLYAVLSLALLATAYAAAWLLTTPVRLAGAVAAAIVVAGVL